MAECKHRRIRVTTRNEIFYTFPAAVHEIDGRQVLVNYDIDPDEEVGERLDTDRVCVDCGADVSDPLLDYDEKMDEWEFNDLLTRLAAQKPSLE